MKFKIDPEFETYWSPLSTEKLAILENSILNDGLHENLVVWKEKNILLDGHQRLSILQRHKIPFDDRIDYLSFPDRLHAKHWVHTTQMGRRGDIPAILAIDHALEFEPLYREEARGRQKEHGGTAPGKHSCINNTEVSGLSRQFMARDCGQGETTIGRVLYIRKYDPKKYADLVMRARRGEEIAIAAEHSIVKSTQDAKKENIEIDKESLEKFKSAREIDAFSEAVRKYKPPINVQQAAAESISENDQVATKNFIEDEIISRLPKKKPKKQNEKAASIQIKESMSKIAVLIYEAINETRRLLAMRDEFGDDLYFQVLADANDLRAAFAEWVVQAKYINKKGDENGKKEKSRLLHS